MHGPMVADAEVCLRGHLALARVYQARDDGVAACATIERFRRLARERLLFPLLVEQADAVEARLYLRQGRLADAMEWAVRMEAPRAEQLPYPREVIHLSWARVQIAGGGPSRRDRCWRSSSPPPRPAAAPRA